MYCARCGHRQSEVATYCSYCGDRLEHSDCRAVWDSGGGNAWDAAGEVWVVGLIAAGCAVLAGSWILMLVR